MTNSVQSESPSEKTFRAYTKEQGAAYAAGRPTYSPHLFTKIVDHHVSTGGKLDVVVDVGCGPGTATQSIAPFFQHAAGLDPSEGMIATAYMRKGKSRSGQMIQYGVSSAEELGGNTGLIDNGTVDLITAATAAHWFDMPRFWHRAAQVLQPGGTVAIWTHNSHLLHASVPNADKINLALTAIKDNELGPYMSPGNAIADKLYEDLILPWTNTSDRTVEFDEHSFLRIYWGTPGKSGVSPEGQQFEATQMPFNLDHMENAINTASAVTRWREANPEKVGTDQDVVKLMKATAQRYLDEAGVPIGQEVLKSHVEGVLLLVKRK